MNKKYLFYISQNYSFAILRPLQAEMFARGDSVVWFFEGSSVNHDFLESTESVLGSVSQIFDYKPDAIIYTANTVPTFLPGINIMVFHGFDAGKVDKKGKNDHFKIRNCFDLYCTQGPSSTLPFKKMQGNSNAFSVVETGWCALDPLYQEKSLNRNKTKPEILLCSTFSKKLSCAPYLYETVKRLSQKNDWHWHVQFHPKMDEEIVNKYKAIQGENLTFHDTDDVLPLLQRADMMVCDTSSVLMMFLLLGKPVVTFKNINPLPYLIDIDNPENLEDSINMALTKPIQLMKNIKDFINETHPYNDGNSSERVLNAIESKLKGSVRNQKIDLARQFKMRKKLNYWKFW